MPAPKKNISNIKRKGWQSVITPNILTGMRVLAVPPLLFLLYLNKPFYDWLALGVFLLAAITDIADGYLARANNQVSQKGKLIDPLADKILIVSLLVSLVGLDRIGVLPVVLILSRDFGVSMFRQVAALKGWAMAASKFGKFKTIMQMIAVGLLLVAHYPLDLLVGRILLWFSVVLTLASGWEYWASLRLFEAQSKKKNGKATQATSATSASKG